MSIDLDKFVGVIPSNLDALDDVIITSVTSGQSLTWNGLKWVNQDKTTDLDNRIVVNTANWATTLGGTIDSLKEYYIDGVVDPAGVSIDLSGGKRLNIIGGGTNVSKIVSTDNNYTMVTGADAGEIMLKGFTYYNIARNADFFNTISGNLKNEFSNSTHVSTIQMGLNERYNVALGTYNAIQWFICDNASDYPEYNGLTKEVVTFLDL